MTNAAPFSIIMKSAYALTKMFFRTYLYGALLLIVVVIAGRGVGSVLLALLDTPHLRGNLGMQIALGAIGVVLVLIGVIAQMLQQVYALVVVVDRTHEVMELLKKSARYVLWLIGGGIWIFLRSFGWLALIGLPFFALARDYPIAAVVGGLFVLLGIIGSFYYLPRFAFINIIQLKEGKTIRQSANASFERTHGYWGKIVGNNCLFALTMMLVSIVAMVIAMLPVGIAILLHYAGSDIAALVLGIPLGIAVIVGAFVFFFGVTLFSQAYVVELYDTIARNPMPAKA